MPRQIANANTLFNVVNTLLFIGFTTWFARLAVRLVPEREVTSGVTIQPQFLDEGALRVPSVALENARREIHRTGMIALDMMDSLRDALLEKDRVKVDNANRREDEIDALSSSILQYLDKVRQAMLTSEESATQQTLMKAIGNIESLADLMEKDTIGIVTTFLAGDYQPSSEETREMMAGLWHAVHSSIELAVKAVGSNDQQAARDVALMQPRIEELADQLFNRLTRHLRSDDPKYLERVRLLMNFIEQLRHMYIFSGLICGALLPAEFKGKPG